MNLRKLLNDCYVEHNIGTLYNIVSSVDNEVGIIVDADPVKGWSIKESQDFLIDNDAKREMVYVKIDEFKDNN